MSTTPLSRLLDRPVVTDAGRRLGRAFDVRARWTDDGLLLDALVLGRRGLLERYGLRRLRSHLAGPEPDVVPSAAILDADRPDGSILVAEAALPQKA